jgi:hypothetical protein
MLCQPRPMLRQTRPGPLVPGQFFKIAHELHELTRILVFGPQITHRGKPQPNRSGLALKLQITKYKLQTNYKLQKNRNQVMVSEMLFKRGFPGYDQKILAKKTRSCHTVSQINTDFQSRLRLMAYGFTCQARMSLIIPMRQRFFSRRFQ